MIWLLSDAALADMDTWRTNTIEVTDAMMVEARGSMVGGSLSVKSGTGEIDVKGVLTKDFDFLAVVFGGGNTSYADIQGALSAAEADPKVKKITMNFDSPGGSISGLFETINAIQRTSKPITAVIDQAASAAYALASQAGTMTATTQASTVGSIGVVAGMPVNSDYTEITSTKAPNKRPDPTTEEGQAVIREHLDGVHDLFVGAIAKGRGTTAAQVNKNYGQGGIVLAKQAKAAGMIDSIVPGPRRSNKKTADSSGMEVKTMDLKQLKAEYPAVFDEAVLEGVKQEKERCEAHLTLAEACGCPETAIEAIKEGAEFGNKYQALYLAASARNAALNARADDNPDTGAPAPVADVTTEQAETQAFEDAIEADIFGDVKAVQND
ncbi:MAG: hypothetical protein GY841_13360 [FCB group bacterium]|nr:hypothetical protein [FCB group bacterium]